MTITRRELLRRVSALGLASFTSTGVVACVAKTADTDTESGTDGTETDGDGLPEYEYDGDPGPEDMFTHGVASGDPLADSVILWTRVRPDQVDAAVFFEVARDPEFTERVAADYVAAAADRDATVKLDVSGLEPATTYYYRFMAAGRASPIGRTRTAPTEAERLRFAVCSCSNYAFGYFHAYKHMAARADLDAVLHLGDYIYEFGDGEYGELRPLDPPYEVLTLDDYRRRYARYREDQALSEAHRQHPFIVIWDDHETANNSYKDGAENHDDDTEGPWPDRRSAGTRAFFEWLPIREGAEGVIYRALPYGGLVDLIMLDTRLAGRDKQTNTPSTQEDPDRQLLGEAQEAWLKSQFEGSTATWRLLGQQVMVAPWRSGAAIFNNDQWDGYVAARARLFDMIDALPEPKNVVILTGDLHSSWATDVPRDGVPYDPQTGAGSLAVEFVTPAITSPGLLGSPEFIELVRESNPHVRWVDFDKRGYVLLDVTAERLQADFFHVQGVTSMALDDEFFAAGFAVESGKSWITPVGMPAPPPADPPPLAPMPPPK
ncbi:MAG: alkaline phosphatase D family protein [Nannocystaceae bacterium]|nr:alkaline phosphatase D family protein [Myxococcales bacterium]